MPEDIYLYLRGGHEAPLSADQIRAKFIANCDYGKMKSSQQLLAICEKMGSMQGDYRMISKLADNG